LTYGGRRVIVGVKSVMRLLALVVTGILLSAPATAQQAGSSASTAPSSSESDAQTPSPNLPVSLDKIRGALQRSWTPPKLLNGLTDTPTFRMEIRARQKIDELLSTLDFKGGPTPPGGVYGYEQQRLVFPPSDNPLAQPYAAFNQGQLLTVVAENLAGKALATHVADAVAKAYRQRAQA